jgi:hypothetical protein
LVWFYDGFQKHLGNWFLFLNVIMKSSLKQFDSYPMNFMIYGLLFSEKQAHFLKSPFHLEKTTWFILKFCKYVLINELYKNKIFNGKNLLGINALFLPNYKKHFEAQKNTKEMDFQICKFLSFLVHPTMYLPYSHPKFPCVMHNVWHMSSY